MADDDLVDVVDVDDRVIEVASRSRIRAENLRHRAVYIVVCTTDDQIVLHRRADWKDVYPGYWDCCFGGVLDAGEDWDAAARRELAEEAGVTTPLHFVTHGRFEDPTGRVIGRVYAGVHDGPYPCPDGEVAAVRTVPRAEVADFLAVRDHCPDSAAFVLPVLDRLPPSP